MTNYQLDFNTLFKFPQDYDSIRLKRFQSIKESIKPAVNLNIQIPDSFNKIKNLSFEEKIEELKKNNIIHIYDYDDIDSFDNVISCQDGVYTIKDEVFKNYNENLNLDLVKFIDQVAWNIKKDNEIAESNLKKRFSFPERVDEINKILPLVENANSCYISILKFDGKSLISKISVGFSNIHSEPVFQFNIDDSIFQSLFKKRKTIIVEKYPQLINELWSNIPEINLRDITPCCFIPSVIENDFYYLFFNFNNQNFNSDCLIELFKTLNNQK